VLETAVVKERVGWSFLGNSSTGPLLEYSRHNFNDRHGAGRVYWAKHFAAPKALGYDVDAFSRWFDQVVRWIRKHGRQKQRAAYEPYFLADAWNRSQRAAEQ
jgi:hypothetical protein